MEQPEKSSSKLGDFLKSLKRNFDLALDATEFDVVWIAAGSEQFYFRDDHGPAFKANAYFGQWVKPEFCFPGSLLRIARGARPALYILAQEDFWHAAPTLPEYLSPYMDLQAFADPASMAKAVARADAASAKAAVIGDFDAYNVLNASLNPKNLLDYLDYHRAKKHEYEICAMRLASDIGVSGHIAARDTFYRGGTEFDVHMAYLFASKQTDSDVPYRNVVALSEHAAIVHYEQRARSHTMPAVSFLIDAGGNYNGYASDITRTYVAEGTQHSEFRELIELIKNLQYQLIEGVRPGVRFPELQIMMHRGLAEVLRTAGLTRISAEEAFERGLTTKFCPHGLGHLLGLQVHDAGGHLADPAGHKAPPPDRYPTLRFTRTIETDQVFTIEPGLYFIPSALAELKGDSAIDWTAVERFLPYGGIRIEDNVRVLPGGVENLTREAWIRAEA